jgi:hypothetical protein
MLFGGYLWVIVMVSISLLGCSLAKGITQGITQGNKTPPEQP